MLGRFGGAVTPFEMFSLSFCFESDAVIIGALVGATTCDVIS